MNTPRLWINKKKRRYYKVMVYRDLLNDLVMMRNWGSLDTARGGIKTEVVDHDQAVELLVKIGKQRIKRNYEIVEG
jgi:predicted DNA-binding WGR domain protein